MTIDRTPRRPGNAPREPRRANDKQQGEKQPATPEDGKKVSSLCGVIPCFATPPRCTGVQRTEKPRNETQAGSGTKPRNESRGVNRRRRSSSHGLRRLSRSRDVTPLPKRLPPPPPPLPPPWRPRGERSSKASVARSQSACAVLTARNRLPLFIGGEKGGVSLGSHVRSDPLVPRTPRTSTVLRVRSAQKKQQIDPCHERKPSKPGFLLRPRSVLRVPSAG